MKCLGKPFNLAMVLAIVIVCGLGLGCGDDDRTPADPVDTGSEAPELPPQSTFIMGFSDFEATGAADSRERPEYALAGTNWGHAAFRVGVWNLLIGIGMSVPSAAFAAAFQHPAEQLADSSWEWTYTVTVGVEHTCRLNGKVVGEEVQWRMYLTKDGFFEDYLWYHGSHNLTLTEGSWTLNRDPALRNPFISIEWHRDPVANTADLTYTNIIPGDHENGGYITFGSTADTRYDRFYDIYNAGLDNLTEIEWNHTTLAGRIRDSNLFGDTDWNCWDTLLENTDCP